ncbi:MAG TPA: FAD-dependent oxidoreductase [Phycisphaerales bacterium]|nr:FAD-dependent oxidoreductase [Phycisphaerales bacterium]
MDLHSGAPFWLLKAGLRSVTPPLASDKVSDVVIIGSGVTGAMLASRLARAGMRVIVLDRRDLATGSTMASTALLMYELDVPLHTLRRRVGPVHADTAYRAGLDAIKLIRVAAKHAQVSCERVPSVLFATSRTASEELHAEHAARRDAGIDVSLLSARQLRKRWGVAAHLAIESRDAAMIDPFAFTHGLLRDAVLHGALVHDRTAVTAVRSSAAHHTLTLSTGVSVRATHVIHATGYEAATQLPPGLVQLSSSFAMITEPLPARCLPRAVLWQRADPYFYARFADNRLLVGGEDEPFVNPAKRDALVATKAVALTRKLRRFLPDLAASMPLQPAFAWAGTFGTTPDGIGYIGEIPNRPRQYYALGFGGNGITFAALASAIIADVIMGTTVTSTQQRATFSFTRRQAKYAR